MTRQPTTFYGLACPTFGEAHGALLRLADGTWICPHAEHRAPANDDKPAAQVAAWSLERLQAIGVAP